MIRTRDEKMDYIKPLIKSLNVLKLYPSRYDEIKELYKCIKEYLETDNYRKIIKIEIKSINKRIVGVLASKHRENVYLKLENM